MKAAFEFLEALTLILVIGVIVILSTAWIVHSFEVIPPPRADLTSPPPSLCPDQFRHCVVSQ